MAVEGLITGAGGQLGSVLMARLADVDRSVLGLASPSGPRPLRGQVEPLDLCDADAVAAVVRRERPRWIIHTAAMTAVGACYRDPSRAAATNVEATRRLAELSSEQSARLIFTSTDLVFDGRAGDYDESSAPSPTSVYARSKVEAERIVLAYAHGVVVRLPLMYGLPGAARATTFLEQLAALREGRPLKLFHDEFRSPLWLEDAAAALQRLAESEFVGLIHAGGPERLSRLEMGRIAAETLGVSAGGVVAVSQADAPFDEPRPADVSLNSSRWAATFGGSAGRTMGEAMRAIAAAYRAL